MSTVRGAGVGRGRTSLSPVTNSLEVTHVLLQRYSDIVGIFRVLHLNQNFLKCKFKLEEEGFSI